MTKINNVIELNGKRFDARTGDLLDSSSTVGSPNISQPASSTKSMDGFIRPSKAVAKQPVPTIAVKPAPSVNTEVRHSRPSIQHPVKPLAAHQPEHSKTLMRNLVKAPAVTKPERSSRAQSPTDLIKSAPAVLSTKPKLSSEQIDASRAERAESVPRSSSVVRFQRNSQPPRQAFSATPAQPAEKSQKSVESITTPRPTGDMFEQAIANASSHEQPAPKESRRLQARRGMRRHARAVSISAAVLAMLLLGGFVAYQNKVALEMQLASARAGFAAAMPGYKPSGYAARSLTYHPGTVTIGYRGSANQTYSVVQRASNWDSATLLQNFVAASGQSYQAFAAAGRTIYIYGDGNATWVNNGIWYQVNAGTAHLNNSQIIDLATSI